jgi:putative Flp pilus-assembly TadE/G-like protein
MRRVSGRLMGRRGSTIVLVAVCLVGVLSAMALAVDLAMLFKARGDAQRAADAIALAGASAFLDGSGPGQNPVALQRADELAAVNHVNGRTINISNPVTTTIGGNGSRRVEKEVTVEVLPNIEKVRVWVRRTDNATWLSNLFGRSFMPVQAYAAAVATPAGSAKCIKPIALPDAWYDAGDDLNNNRIWDPNEKWLFGDDAGDRYDPYTGNGGAADETGYGGNWRNPPQGDNKTVKDFGRPLQLKSPDPKDPYNPQPSVFNPWRIPADGTPQSCGDKSVVYQDQGAAAYRQNICQCNGSSVKLGEEYPIETGNMVGPTFQGFKELIAQDKDARWDDNADGGKGAVVDYDPKYGEWMNSPRVVKVALYEPGQITKPGMQTIHFNNFGLFFVEDQQGPKKPIAGRFITYVSGEDEGPTTGPLVKILRLVE